MHRSRSPWLLSSLICVLMLLALPAAAQTKPSYLEQPATLSVVGKPAPGEKLALIIALPAAGSSAGDVFSSLAPHVPASSYALLVPHGAPPLSEVLKGFANYVKWYEERILADVRSALAQKPIDPERIFLVGFSLGGDLACSLLTRHPELYRGAFVLSSRCSASLSSTGRAALLKRDGRVSFAIGSADDATRQKGIKAAYERLKVAKITTRFASYEGAHQLPRDPKLVRESFALWFAPKQ